MADGRSKLPYSGRAPPALSARHKRPAVHRWPGSCPRLFQSPRTDRGEIHSRSVCGRPSRPAVRDRRHGPAATGRNRRVFGANGQPGEDSRLSGRTGRNRIGALPPPEHSRSGGGGARGSRGSKILVAYVVANGGPGTDLEGWQAFLRKSLPDYMIPAQWCRSSTACPSRPTENRPRCAVPVRSRNPGPAQLAARRRLPTSRRPTTSNVGWSEFGSGRSTSGRSASRSHFFDLGGDSLLAVSLFIRDRRGIWRAHGFRRPARGPHHPCAWAAHRQPGGTALRCW